ncbi:hypothetical protein SAMN06269185_2534 [Natronoarchaeum philippinense]|uniref:Uncharacterized protein n=1 Tax=Natronoarchaeum philippinense TaxID=558529 RepID=A0A285P1L4_NATPI|nr:hypothetical protein [Natronoarchaeum philippinense]SNZ15625.1 hypothetical protein SAMN06269185_2534 [Natronoarchaeum philippinense]
MRITLSDARDSSIAAAILLLGVGAAAYAAYYTSQGGEFGAPTGSLPWWLGVGAAIVAVVVTLVRARA